MKVFAATIFLGAFLLFQVQPLIAKFILPWYGGTPAVWTTCMLFFQATLLAGYAYAHCSVSSFSPRGQTTLHVGLLLAAVVWLPIVPGSQWKPGPADEPTRGILLLLTACLGLPYFVLSSTGPLLQAWLSRLHPGRVPYRLYALSNAGSMLALVSYPFLFEPRLTRRAQASLWAWGFGLFVVLCGVCAWRFRWAYLSSTLDLPLSRPSATLSTAQSGGEGKEKGRAPVQEFIARLRRRTLSQSDEGRIPRQEEETAPEPTPDPSQEGSKTADAGRQFPSSEGSEVDRPRERPLGAETPPGVFARILWFLLP